MVETFPAIVPSIGTRKSQRFRVLKSSFGDGYTQRVKDGLNSTRQEWNIIWLQLTESDADTITDFLDDREGAEAFNWTTPIGANLKFSNPEGYVKTPTASTHSTITAKFLQEFDL